MVIYIILHTTMKLLIKSYKSLESQVWRHSLPYPLVLGCKSIPLLPSYIKYFQCRSDGKSSRFSKVHHSSIPIGLSPQASPTSTDTCTLAICCFYLHSFISYLILLFQDPLLPWLCFPSSSLLQNRQSSPNYYLTIGLNFATSVIKSGICDIVTQAI